MSGGQAAGGGEGPLRLYFQRFLTGAPAVPTRAYTGDAGWDLVASRPASVAPFETANVHTDIAVAIPDGWYGHILSRSSSLKRGLRISPAVIDAGYRGELFVQVQNAFGDRYANVQVGERIAQLIILPVPTVEWQEVEALPPSDRGPHGFGSSGR